MFYMFSVFSVTVSRSHSNNRAEGNRVRGRVRFRNENDLRIGERETLGCRQRERDIEKLSEVKQALEKLGGTASELRPIDCYQQIANERKTASPTSQPFRNRTRPRTSNSGSYSARF